MKVDPRRIFIRKPADPHLGPVVYWMQRDQRVQDNWALLYAQEQALAMQQSLLVVFCMVPGFQGATIRQYGFMITGLSEVARKLARLNIPFYLLQGLPQDVLPRFLVQNDAGVLVTDFNPLRLIQDWKTRLTERIDIPFHEVDAHNIIPCRHVSDKPEYAAFTLRKKVEKQLPEFLTPFPVLSRQPHLPDEPEMVVTDWSAITRSLRVDNSVSEVDWLFPGENAGCDALQYFLAERLNKYNTDRNFPDKKGQSELSPYLHFGHLSAQRIAF
ncbi:MAG: deoxyribodipyrimidine photo-lyase, partial [Bacteroidetes bacterium]|nr:deoxyribodipyrimidine photo-lyase [Bacteroidota bacterium]